MGTAASVQGIKATSDEELTKACAELSPADQEKLAKAFKAANVDMSVITKETAPPTPSWPEDAAGTRILLISDSLPAYEKLIQAALPEVVVVPVQYRCWTLHRLKQEIAQRAGPPKQQYKSIGLLDHGKPDKFCLLECLGDGAVDLECLKRNVDLQSFFKFIGKYIQPPEKLHFRDCLESRIDLMACCVAATSEGEDLITYIEDLAQVNVAASTDKTGAGHEAEGGFDWIMETEEGLGSIHTHYFIEERIKEWKQVMYFQINYGPLSFGTGGFAVKPKWNYGVETANANIGGGVNDVRDGLEFGVEAEAFQEWVSCGHSFDELSSNVKMGKTLLPAGIKKKADDALQVLIEHSPRKMLDEVADFALGDLMQHLGVHIDMTIKFTAVGVGIGGKICLGWEDTGGFNMVGCAGGVSAMMKIGADFFAGRHNTNSAIKLIIGMANVEVTLVISYLIPHEINHAWIYIQIYGFMGEGKKDGLGYLSYPSQSNPKLTVGNSWSDAVPFQMYPGGTEPNSFCMEMKYSGSQVNNWCVGDTGGNEKFMCLENPDLKKWSYIQLVPIGFDNNSEVPLYRLVANGTGPCNISYNNDYDVRQYNKVSDAMMVKLWKM